ncbi:MAG: IS982 family transposase [Oscillospiraceae bacterium]|nr:IS982 family transposase [Oscillospiraceae bacterium]
MAIYLFGIAEGKCTVRAVYDFIKDYWAGWFPSLPSYQNFNRRINFLAPAFRLFYSLLIHERGVHADIRSFLLDSMPIMVANSKRAKNAKSAPEMCDKGYCSSKNTYYYGVKLHTLGQKQHEKLPLVFSVNVTPASENDITVAKEWLDDVHDMDIFADKMYASKPWSNALAERNVRVFTPVKLKKGQKVLGATEKAYSAAVSRARQAIESFFNWINQKTGIQNASKVRSDDGLLAFIFARLASLAVFYS